MTNRYAVLRMAWGVPYAEILSRHEYPGEARNAARGHQGKLGLDASPIVRELVDDYQAGARILYGHLRDFTHGD